MMKTNFITMKGGQIMSNCSKLQELISLYCDGEIAEHEKELVEKHISECEHCKQKLDIMLKAKKILENSPVMPVPENLFNDFIKRKETEEKEKKKIIPFYKNYRVYTSVAAVFIFALVLKSGLLEQNKYISEPVTQGTYTEQTLSAPAKSDVQIVEKNVPEKAASEQEAFTQKARKAEPENQPEQQNNPVEVAESLPVHDVASPASDEALENTPQALALEDADTVPASQGGGGSGASNYARTALPPDTADDVDLNEEVVPETMAEIYVLPQYLERATELLSDNFYLLYQAEQKLIENEIPFESNFLLLDESQLYQITVTIVNE